MPFKKRTREFWIEAGGGQCQWVEYSEKRGFEICGRTAKHVHHIYPESGLLAEGYDPEHTVGLPLCESHHVRNLNGEPFDHDSSFHPEMGRAYQQYGEWKQQAQHLSETMGKRSIDYSDSPFAETNREYKERMARGERVCTGDDATDQFYYQEMRDKATRYFTESGKTKPQTSPHPDTDPEKKKKWYNMW